MRAMNETPLRLFQAESHVHDSRLRKKDQKVGGCRLKTGEEDGEQLWILVRAGLT